MFRFGNIDSQGRGCLSTNSNWQAGFLLWPRVLLVLIAALISALLAPGPNGPVAHAADACYNYYSYPLAEAEYQKSTIELAEAYKTRDAAKLELDAAEESFSKAQKYARSFDVVDLLEAVEEGTRLDRRKAELVAAYIALRYVEYQADIVTKITNSATLDLQPLLNDVIDEVGIKDDIIAFQKKLSINPGPAVGLPSKEFNAIDFGLEGKLANSVLTRDNNGFMVFIGRDVDVTKIADLMLITLQEKVKSKVVTYNKAKIGVDDGGFLAGFIDLFDEEPVVLESYTKAKNDYHEKHLSYQHYEAALQKAAQVETYWNKKAHSLLLQSTMNGNEDGLADCKDEKTTAQRVELCSTPFTPIQTGSSNSTSLANRVNYVCDPNREEYLTIECGIDDPVYPNLCKALSESATPETVVGSPTINSISPNSGDVAGGTTINITGTNFWGPVKLTIAGLPISDLTVISSTEISVKTPAANKIGAVDAQVSTFKGAGSAKATFTYTAANGLPIPKVSAVTPASGPSSGGTRITIEGTGFSGTTSVTIGGKIASELFVVSPVLILAKTPAGTLGDASIVVVNNFGNSAAGANFTYADKVQNPPVKTDEDKPKMADASRPGVVISGAPTSLPKVLPFSVTVQFSEAVMGFEASELLVGNGTVSSFSVIDSSVYNAVVTPDGNGNVTLDVNANIAVDTDGNGNDAALRVTILNSITETTKLAAADVVKKLATHMLNNQPNISGFLDGTNLGGNGIVGNFNFINTGNLFNLSYSHSLSQVSAETEKVVSTLQSNRVPHFNDSAGLHGTRQQSPQPSAPNLVNTDTEANLSPAQRRGFDVWTQIYGSRSFVGTAKSSLWVGYLGAHYFVTTDTLVGGMAQIDWSKESNNAAGSTANGTGWMIGPYVATKIPGKAIYLDARAAWGRSSNSITANGLGENKFDTERWMVSGKISGAYKTGDWTISPAVTFSYFRETQEAFTDNFLNVIPEQIFSIGQLQFGPTFSRTIKIDPETMIVPRFGVSGIWNFDLNDNTNSQGSAPGTNDLRMRLNAGIIARKADRWSIDTSGFYDGIGVSNYYSYGGKVRLNLLLR